MCSFLRVSFLLSLATSDLKSSSLSLVTSLLSSSSCSFSFLTSSKWSSACYSLTSRFSCLCLSVSLICLLMSLILTSSWWALSSLCLDLSFSSFSLCLRSLCSTLNRCSLIYSPLSSIDLSRSVLKSFTCLSNSSCLSFNLALLSLRTSRLFSSFFLTISLWSKEDTLTFELNSLKLMFHWLSFLL